MNKAPGEGVTQDATSRYGGSPYGCQGWDVAGRHLVQFYDEDADLVGGLADFVGEGLCARGSALLFATSEHREALERRLQGDGIDIDSARADGRLLVRDAEDVRSRVVAGAKFDQVAFEDVVASDVRGALVPGQPLRIFGEIVALMWQLGQVTEAMELEQAWGELCSEVSAALLCAYPSYVVAPQPAVGLDRVCNLHSDLVGVALEASAGGAVGGAARSFDNATDAPRRARHFVRSSLEQWGLDHLLEDASLVVTELATNVVLHAGSEFRVGLAASPVSLKISVEDTSPVAPAHSGFAEAGCTGRGLQLVSALSRQWGTAHQPASKVVWAELAR